MSTPIVLARVDDIARRQNGVIAGWQLAEAGLSSQLVAKWVKRGLLVRVGPEVYRLPGSPATWHQEVTTAALTSGGLASHRTAAAVRGLDGFPATLIEVLTLRWKRRARQAFIVHESTSLRDVDVDVHAGVPCTTLVRTLVDLTAVCSIDRAGLALDHARRREPDILHQVHRRFLEVARRGRPGTAKMRILLADRLGEGVPTGSYFESLFLRLIRQAGIPEPERQYEVRTDKGVFRLDFAWPEPKVCAECNGYAFHSSKRAMQRDSVRRRSLVRAGWRPLDFTYDDVARTPDFVAAEVRDALKSKR
jgi:very-short-patch-repair endonuclease/predicted transcriptional regulator of viral defense system